MMAIAVSGLSKRYGEITALAEITFSLSAGTVYGLFGPNGSGKSALLRILATLERPTAGQVMVFEKDASAEPQAVRRALGFVPQSFGVHAGLTVAEHLDFFATCYGLSRRERLAAVDAMLQLVELQAWREQLATALSHGLRQRLALATALLHNPELLLLDEPFAGIDAVGRTELLEVLKELRAMGKTILISSYRLEDVAPLCDAIGLLHGGRLIASGPIEEVLAAPSEIGCLVRLSFASDIDVVAARRVLATLPEVGPLHDEEGCLTFKFGGGREAVPALLERLVGAGIRIVEIKAETIDHATALVRALQDLEA